jgi:CheY-like chemotaxis protein
LILTDLEMPNLDGLELVEAVRRDFAQVPVVLMTAHGSEEIAAMALCNGAASYIPKAYLNQDLTPTIERILALTNANRQYAHAFDCLAASEFHFVLRNDPMLIAPIVGYLEEVIKLLKLCDATSRMRVSVALQEALLNAIYHGNLELDSNLHPEDDAAFRSLVMVRRELPQYQERRVHLDVSVSSLVAKYTIRDDGPGFDVKALPDPHTPANLDQIGGRGLLLIRTFMDEVSHNERGNVITMMKRHEF